MDDKKKTKKTYSRYRDLTWIACTNLMLATVIMMIVCLCSKEFPLVIMSLFIIAVQYMQLRMMVVIEKLAEQISSSRARPIPEEKQNE